VGFQRARSAEQREERRRAILDTAAAMLREMPVSAVTLTALAGRAGLAKSAVLRYFDSREAVLLELLDAEWVGWRAELASAVGGAVTAESAADRCVQLADVLARTVVARPVLCDLGAAQASVLEHNVSAEVAARFKHCALREIGALAALLREHLPLAEEAAVHCAGAAMMAVGAAWAHSRPSAAMEAAYAADPVLAAMKLDFGDVVRELLEVLLRGYLAR
jgi:AcrR family transcriptional regulator